MDLRGALKAVRASAWVGWQVDSNWTEPFIFIGIQIVRPLASTMLFPLLYVVGMRLAEAPIDLEYLAYLIIGTVFFTPFIFAAETGGQIVSQDRERYGVMKSIYLSKASLTPYLFGRLLAELGLSVIATAASAIFAFTAFTYGLGLPVQLMLKDAVKFVLSILAVYLGAAALYYLLPSINLLTNKLHWSLTYYVLGFLYLAGDVLFPVSSLNQLLAPLEFLLPVNQALNAARSAFGLRLSGDPLQALAVSTVWMAAGLYVFSRAVGYARRKGLLDRIGWW
jgi:ABC-2 type transport system permease protein